MNRITPERTQRLFQMLLLLPKRNTFCTRGYADVLGALWVEKFGLADALKTNQSLEDGEVTYREIADPLDLDREYVEGFLAGWDGFLLSSCDTETDIEHTEAGFEDGVSGWSAVNGW